MSLDDFISGYLGYVLGHVIADEMQLPEGSGRSALVGMIMIGTVLAGSLATRA